LDAYAPQEQLVAIADTCTIAIMFLIIGLAWFLPKAHEN
jgi:hypothetical protein